MARTAHYRTVDADKLPMITVRDDRGIPLRELELQQAVDKHSDIDKQSDIDGELLAAGFSRSADWTQVDDGWVAPVVPADSVPADS